MGAMSGPCIVLSPAPAPVGAGEMSVGAQGPAGASSSRIDPAALRADAQGTPTEARVARVGRALGAPLGEALGGPGPDAGVLDLIVDGEHLLVLPWGWAAPSGGAPLGRRPGLLVRLSVHGVPARPAAAPGAAPRGIAFLSADAGGPVPDVQLADLLRHGEAACTAGAGRAALEAALLARPAVLVVLARVGADGALVLGRAGATGERMDADAWGAVLSVAPPPVVLLLALGEQGAQAPAVAGLLAAAHRAGVGGVLGGARPLSRSGALVLVAAWMEHLVRGAATVEDAVRAARAALDSPEYIDDARALCWLARPEDGDETRPLPLRPFPGLGPMGPGEAAFFFGREREVAALVAAFDALDAEPGRPRVLALVGGAGTGRSSLVGAGLGPALRERGVGVAVVDPAVRPVEALDAALAAAGAGRRLIVVDPFHPLLLPGHLPDEEQRAALAVLAARATPGGPDTVLIVLRTELLPRCAGVRLGEGGARLEQVLLDPAHAIMLGVPDLDALARMVEEPARRAGLQAEPALLQRVVAEAHALPDPLPRLAVALERVWEAREGRLLSVAALDAIGGLPGAVAHRADAVLDALPDDAHREAARAVLVALVHRGDHTAPDLPATVLRASLLPSGTAAEQSRVEAVIRHLVEGRLLRPGPGPGPATLTLAHEALLIAWPRLRGWLDAPAAAGGGAAALPPSGGVDPRRWSQKKRYRWGAAGVLAGVALVALPRLLARGAITPLSLSDADPTAAVAFARSLQPAPGDAEWLARANALLQAPLARAVYVGTPGPVGVIQPAPAGGALLLGQGDGLAVWDESDESGPRAVWPGAAVAAAGWSAADGEVFVVDRTGAVWLWPVGDAEAPPRSLRAAGAGPGVVAAVAADGGVALVVQDGDAILLDPTGAERARAPLPSAQDGGRAVPRLAAVAADGGAFAVGAADGSVFLWSSAGRDPLRYQHPGLVHLEWSPDGQRLLTVGGGRMRLVGRDGGGAARTPATVEVDAAGFGPVGQTVGVSYRDGTTDTHRVRFIGPDERDGRVESEALEGAAAAIALDAAARTVLRARADGAVELLAFDTGRPTGLLRGHGGPVVRIVAARSGTALFTASEDGVVRVWELDRPAVLAPLPAPAALASADALQLHPTGGGWVLRGPDGRWSHLPPGPAAPLVPVDPPADPPALPAGASASAWSPSGTPLIGHADGRLVLGEKEVDLGSAPLDAVCASPDGISTAAVGRDGEVSVWEPATGRRRTVGQRAGQPVACSFSATGSQLLVESVDAVTLWSLALDRAVLTAPIGAAPVPSRVALAEDELRVLGAGGEIGRHLWDPLRAQSALWSATPSCGGLRGGSDLGRFCACAACTGAPARACDDAPLVRMLAALRGPADCPGR